MEKTLTKLLEDFLHLESTLSNLTVNTPAYIMMSNTIGKCSISIDTALDEMLLTVRVPQLDIE